MINGIRHYRASELKSGLLGHHSQIIPHSGGDFPDKYLWCAHYKPIDILLCSDRLKSNQDWLGFHLVQYFCQQDQQQVKLSKVCLVSHKVVFWYLVILELSQISNTSTLTATCGVITVLLWITRQKHSWLHYSPSTSEPAKVFLSTNLDAIKERK